MPSVKTLRSQFSPLVFSDGIQRRALSQYQSEEMKVLNNSFSRVESNPQPAAFTDTNLYLTKNIIEHLKHKTFQIYKNIL